MALHAGGARRAHCSFPAEVDSVCRNGTTSGGKYSKRTKDCRIRFSTGVKVREYDRDPILRHKADLWYSNDEIKQQRQRDLRVLGVIRRESFRESSITPEVLVKSVHSILGTTGENSDSQEQAWDIRGLESLLDNGERKARNKLRGTLAVLMEQDRQDREGGEDPNTLMEEISFRYRRAAAFCLEMAYRQGEQDRRAIEEQPPKETTTATTGIGPLFTREVCIDPAILRMSVPSRAA